MHTETLAHSPSRLVRLQSRLQRLREFFLLRDAEQRALALDPAERERLGHAVQLAFQRRRAAELLWQHGARAEALRLARSAYELLANRASDAQSTARLSELDEQVTPDEEELFHTWIEGHAALDRDLRFLPLDPRARVQWRALRLGVLGLAVLLSSTALWWSRRPRVYVDASAYYSLKYMPSNVIDGLETTEWLLPDKTPGYIDLQLVPPRQVSSLSVVNGFDPAPYGVVDYRLEAWKGDRIVKTVDGTMPAAAGRQPAVPIAFATEQKVDKIRIVVKTWRDLGGGLAEVRVE